MTGPRIAVVVPTETGQADRCLAALRSQSPPPDEVEIVARVRPSGRARNLGAHRTSADILVFLDDDAELGAADTLARLVAPLAEDPMVAVTGTAKLTPPDATRFQRQVARQVPRVEQPVAEQPVDVTPPSARFSYTAVTTTCCALRRATFDQVGGFDERLFRGVDSEFFYRITKTGGRFLLVPGAWVFHAPPPTMTALLTKHFHYGIGFAQEVRLHPERGGRRFLHTPLHAAAYLALRTVALPLHVLLPYSLSNPRLRPGFRPLGALASYAAALGYVYGWYRAGLAVGAAEGGR